MALFLVPRGAAGADRNPHRLTMADLTAQLAAPGWAFWVAALVGVTVLGLAKGGFAGLGVLGVPIMALGMSLSGYLTLTSVAVQWFERRRATALALTAAAPWAPAVRPVFTSSKISSTLWASHSARTSAR